MHLVCVEVKMSSHNGKSIGYIRRIHVDILLFVVYASDENEVVNEKFNCVLTINILYDELSH
jgi:hypothetical protein